MNIDEKVPKLLDFTRKLLDQAVEIVNNSLPPIELVDVEEFYYFLYLRVQISEALKFGYGAYYSCSSKWGHGGIGAARSIYEIALDITYINQDEKHRKERATRFIDHGAEYLYRRMEIERKLGKEIPQNVVDEYSEAYDRLKDKYNARREQEVNSGVENPSPGYSPFNWAGISITKKADVVNQEEIHQLYKVLSELSHASTRAILDAIKDTTGNQIEVDLKLRPSADCCSDVLFVVFLCISRILLEYMAYFKMDHTDYPTLEKLWTDYSTFFSS